MAENRIQLGDKARDTITGLTGTVISTHVYLNGCIRITLQPSELQDGRPVDPYTLDIEQCELVESKTTQKQAPVKGGPRDTPSRPSVPSR